MHEIVLLHCPEIGMHLAFFYACVEGCNAFSRMGYSVRIARSISELNNNCIVFLGDDFHVSHPADLLAKQAPRAVYIGWCWNNQDVRKLPHFVHTHQNNLKQRVPTTYLNSGSTNIVKVPFLLRANDDPALIGTYPKKIVRHYCYMGYRYNPELVPSSKYVGYYHGTKNLAQFLNYETRKRIYLGSMFALGFQSKANADDRHVSQRIYEGLAYGCVVLSNSEAACDQTNGIVEFVSSQREIEDKIDYYLKNPKAYIARQSAGYHFIKNRGGTNHAMAGLFIDAINTAFPGIL